jgi:hypothetical protein
MQFSFDKTIKQAEKDYGLGKGEYFKVQEGKNRIRILSEFIAHQSEFKGQVNTKFVGWIIDRNDSKIKLYFMPISIMNAIADLQLSDDYAFTEVPMPYDVTIVATNAGTKEVKYSVLPSPKEIPLTEAELEEFNKKPSVAEVIQKLREGQKSSPGAEYEATEHSNAPAQRPMTGYEKAKAVAAKLPHSEPEDLSDEELAASVPF